MYLFFDIVVQTYQDFWPRPSWRPYFILYSPYLHDLKSKISVKSGYTQIPKVTTVGILSCSSRTDKNELCVLGECILHPTCCIVIKVPPVLYRLLYFVSSQYVVHSFDRICILKPDPLPPPTPRRCSSPPLRLSLAAMPCARLYQTKMRPHFDRANAACHSAAAIGQDGQLQHGNHDLRKWLQRKHQIPSGREDGSQSVFAGIKRHIAQDAKKNDFDLLCNFLLLLI